MGRGQNNREAQGFNPLYGEKQPLRFRPTQFEKSFQEKDSEHYARAGAKILGFLYVEMAKRNGIDPTSPEALYENILKSVDHYHVIGELPNKAYKTHREDIARDLCKEIKEQGTLSWMDFSSADERLQRVSQTMIAISKRIPSRVP